MGVTTGLWVGRCKDGWMVGVTQSGWFGLGVLVGCVGGLSWVGGRTDEWMLGMTQSSLVGGKIAGLVGGYKDELMVDV